MSTKTTEAANWTLAYRKPHANRFQRVTNWAGTWQEAVDMSGKFREANPGQEVWYVSTREAEQSGYVPSEDIGNILTGSGKRVRIIDDGKLDLTLTADSIVTHAREIGAEHGRNAASYVFDGNTSNETYSRIIQLTEDGDPAVYDTYRAPDLSGEFAGSYDESDLVSDLGLIDDPSQIRSDTYYEVLNEACDAYNIGASEAFWSELERIAREHIESHKLTELQSAGFQVQYIDPAGIHDDGTVSPYGHYRYSTADDKRRAYVELGHIGQSEDAYGQSTTLQRSNYRRLREDYPEAWSDTSYSNTDALGAFVTDLTLELIEILAKVRNEYPAYDDEDMSAIEDDEIQEQWDDFGASDLARELPDNVREEWEALSADDQRQLFSEACDAVGYYPEHNGIEVLWSYAYERTVPYITEKLGK